VPTEIISKLGDYEAANTMMHPATLAEARRGRGLIARLFQRLAGR
jgi:hypothetical protein